MESINDKRVRVERPVKVLQFGEGNFLRAFVDYMIDIANEKGVYDGNVVIVQPIDAPLNEAFAKQDCKYTVVLRGKADGDVINTSRIVTSVETVISAYRDYGKLLDYAYLESLECIVSNTTEAGIAYDDGDSFEYEPPRSYPGKLTRFLYERYEFFNGDAGKGLTIYPVELIDNNGGCLKECVKRLAAKWNLGDDFIKWIDDSCLFCSTLVDRIVTGYPKKPGEAEKICEGLGYEDGLVDIAEPFGLWVIEAADIDRASGKMPLHRADLPVIFTDSQKPYRERKVRVLNGAHTCFVPAAFLAGENIVRDCMAQADIRMFIDKAVYEEILPTVPLPADEVKAFADSVCERFENPFIDHELLSICLNSVSKWKVRVLPSLKDSMKLTGQLPKCLTMSFASLTEFYSRGSYRTGADGENEGFFGDRDGTAYQIKDNEEVIDFFKANGKREDIISLFAGHEKFWGEDLNKIPGFVSECEKYLGIIRRDGALAAMKESIY